MLVLYIRAPAGWIDITSIFFRRILGMRIMLEIVNVIGTVRRVRGSAIGILIGGSAAKTTLFFHTPHAGPMF